MRLFCFLGSRSEAGFEIQRVGGREEGAVGGAEVEVVDLADLGPDGVQVAGFVSDFAGLGMDSRFVEALQRPEEVVGGLQADGFARVGHDGVTDIGYNKPRSVFLPIQVSGSSDFLCTSARFRFVCQTSGVNDELEFVAIQQTIQGSLAGESLGKLEYERNTFATFVHDGGAV